MMRPFQPGDGPHPLHVSGNQQTLSAVFNNQHLLHQWCQLEYIVSCKSRESVLNDLPVGAS